MLMVFKLHRNHAALVKLTTHDFSDLVFHQPWNARILASFRGRSERVEAESRAFQASTTTNCIALRAQRTGLGYTRGAMLGCLSKMVDQPKNIVLLWYSYLLTRRLGGRRMPLAALDTDLR